MAGNDLVERLLRLWNNVPLEGDVRGAFLELYTDPVRINGVELSVDQLIVRARAMARALTERTTQVLSIVEQEGRLAVAFQITATHSGPLGSPLGDVAPTGKRVTTQVIDVLHLQNGRIHELWMVADILGQLLQLGAVQRVE